MADSRDLRYQKERPQLGDTPAGKTLKPKPKAKPEAAPTAGQSVKKLIKDAATGGGNDVISRALRTFPDWQKNIRGK